MLTRRKILNDLAASLEPIYGLREARSISGIVVESLMGWSRIDCSLGANDVVELSNEQSEQLHRVTQELKQNRPVQYVLGECEFYGLNFNVCEDVLIPRPETEELVDWICSQHEHTHVEILDIGTGSGAIAVALKHAMGSFADVSAVDISDTALDIAARNADRNETEVKFSKVDILAPPQIWLEADQYDIIVSNPPYIPVSDRDSMRENVLSYEPHIALFVDDSSPLLFYDAIANHALTLLNSGGWLYFEIYEYLADELIELLGHKGYTDIELRADINDKPRMIRCRKSL